jgi:hypothetical protein
LIEHRIDRLLRPGIWLEDADRVGEGLRSFLRQIVPDAALDDSVRVLAREFLGIGTTVRVWCTIGICFSGPNDVFVPDSIEVAPAPILTNSVAAMLMAATPKKAPVTIVRFFEHFGRTHFCCHNVVVIWRLSGATAQFQKQCQR